MHNTSVITRYSLTCICGCRIGIAREDSNGPYVRLEDHLRLLAAAENHNKMLIARLQRAQGDVMTEYELHTKGARHTFEPEYDGNDPDRNRSEPAASVEPSRQQKCPRCSQNAALLFTFTGHGEERGVVHCGCLHGSFSTPSPRPVANVEPTRTDADIVRQTEELARLLMLEVYSREAPEGLLFRKTNDPRGKHCWQLACKAQEILTATDPENAASEVDDVASITQPAVSAKPIYLLADEEGPAHWIETDESVYRWWKDQGTRQVRIVYVATDTAQPRKLGGYQTDPIRPSTHNLPTGIGGGHE